MDNQENTCSREHLTVLLRRHSVAALCCGILTLCLAFYGIIAGVNRTTLVLQENGFTSFIYYTMISNTLGALSMAFVFPYTVDGIRRKRLILPKWVAVLHYVATTSIMITMFVVVFFIGFVSPEDAFGHANIVTHVFCPLLILISFFQMENGHLLTLKDRLIAIIPFTAYMVVYLFEVVAIGEANGGWPDIYRIQELMAPALAIPIALLIAFVTSTAIAKASNRLHGRRKEKMYRFWCRDMESDEVLIEAFGMGMMAVRHGDKYDLRIPYDILEELAGRYNLEVENLMKLFVKGLMMELKSAEDKLEPSTQNTD